MANARRQARLKAEAKRKLEAVACTPLFGPDAAAPPSNGQDPHRVPRWPPFPRRKQSLQRPGLSW
jgi:hypothetical protein